jgi:hypothetical protein
MTKPRTHRERAWTTLWSTVRHSKLIAAVPGAPHVREVAQGVRA